ncbi:MAG: adenylate/guanylate cyclase domain-containing protein [Candidatus Woesearchaeota archaeon]
MKQKTTYLNDGAEEFVNSLKHGTIPLNDDEDDFFEKLKIDSEQYLNGKIDRFEDPEYKEKDPSEEYLYNYYKSTKKKTINVVILSVDIVGSTKLSHILKKESYATLISLFLRAMAQIVYNYNGYTLKFVGDEVLAYFPGPDTQGMHDNALYCAYAIKKYVLTILNPLLKDIFMPKISFRMSLNSGQAMLTVVGHPISMQHFDLIGEPINLAKKMQIKSEIDSILIGQSATSFAHKFWRTKAQEIILEDNKDIKIHKININV